MSFVIRKASIKDAPALALIGAATFLETFSGILSGEAIVSHCSAVHNADCYRQYLDQGAQAWLAEIEPGLAPIGYALLATPDLAIAEDGDIELKRIYSLSLYHGTGLGAALLNTAVLQTSGYRRLLLGVYMHNERAIAFYQKHGFSKVGERQFNVGGTFYDDLLMARALV